MSELENSIKRHDEMVTAIHVLSESMRHLENCRYVKNIEAITNILTEYNKLSILLESELENIDNDMENNIKKEKERIMK